MTGEGRRIETAAMACCPFSGFLAIAIMTELNRRLELAVHLPIPTEHTIFSCVMVVPSARGGQVRSRRRRHRESK